MSAVSTKSDLVDTIILDYINNKLSFNEAKMILQGIYNNRTHCKKNDSITYTDFLITKTAEKNCKKLPTYNELFTGVIKKYFPSDIVNIIINYDNSYDNKRTRFKNTDLSYIDFSNTDYSNVNFKGSNLSYSNFNNSNCSQAVFIGVDLSYSSFINATLYKAYLKKSNCMFTNFTNANLYRVNAMDAIFIGSNCTSVNWKAANLTRTDLSYAIIDNGNFLGTRVYNTNLSYCSFISDKIPIAFGDMFIYNLNINGAVISGTYKYINDMNYNASNALLGLYKPIYSSILLSTFMYSINDAKIKQVYLYEYSKNTEYDINFIKMISKRKQYLNLKRTCLMELMR